MIFPKVTSLPLNQLITDSSELTSQESYIFNTIFQKDLQSFKQEHDAHNKLQSKSITVTDDSLKNQPLLYSQHSIMTKIIISIILTGIILLYTISPIPSMLNTLLKTNSTIAWGSVVGLFAFAYFFLVKFIR